MKKKINKEVKELLDSGVTNKSEIARRLYDKSKGTSFDSFRRTINNIVKRLENVALSDECERLGIDMDTVDHFWHKGKHFSIHSKVNKDFNHEEFRSQLVADIKSIAVPHEFPRNKKSGEPHLLMFDPADIHIGKLCSSFESGEDYNSQIAVQRVMQGLNGIIDESSGYNIEKVLFIAGNDILHIDSPKRITTSGTPQDTDGMWYDNFITAKKLLIEVISRLSHIAPVHVVFNPSNHDYMSGFLLMQCVEAFFSKSSVTFDVDISHRKYYRYHNNLIGTTHGDGAKQENLALLMAHEAKKDWAETKHKYFFGHHLHHKVSKDYMSVAFEALRTPSGTDSWHHRNGYQHAPKAVEAFIFHPEYGQKARLTHLF